MEEYKVKQIYPAHADHITHYKEKWLNEMFATDEVVAQRKYDGERMLVHFNGNETYCTSRRESKKTGRYMENQDKIVNLPTVAKLGYTVIDCECYSNTWSDVVGVLHSLPDRAYELQKSTVIKFAVFDCIWFDGCDISNQPYKVRYEYAKKIVDLLQQENNDARFHIVTNIPVKSLLSAYDIAEQHWKQGLEGIVIKSLNKAYYDKGAMLKVKRSETVDLVVYDWWYGTGKYKETVGALCVGYYDPEKDIVVHVTRVNCGTDSDRNWWRDNWPNNQYTVLEVKAQEITETSLRHPVYIRIRNDKNYKECTKDTIFKS